MELKISTGLLKGTVNKVVKIVPHKSTSEYGTSVFLKKEGKRLSVQASNHIIYLTSYCEDDTFLKLKDFKVCVNARLFSVAIDSFDETENSEIKMVMEDNELKVQSGKKKYKFPTYNTKKYPKPIELSGENIKEFTWSPEMRTAILNALPYTAKYHNQSLDGEKFGSVFLNQDTVVASDGVDLYVRKYENKFLGVDVLIPNITITQFDKFTGDVKGSTDGNLLEIKSTGDAANGFEIISPLTKMDFPDCQSIVNKFTKNPQASIEIKKGQLEKAIKDAQLVCDGPNQTAVYKVGKTSLRLETKGFSITAASEVEIDCKSDAELNTELVNAKVLRLLSSINSDTITLNIGSNELPAHYIQEDNLIVATMPIARSLIFGREEEKKDGDDKGVN